MEIRAVTHSYGAYKKRNEDKHEIELLELIKSIETSLTGENTPERDEAYNYLFTYVLLQE